MTDSDDMPQFHKTRNEVHGITVDQGTEHDIADDGVGVIPQCRGVFESTSVDAFPKCVVLSWAFTYSFTMRLRSRAEAWQLPGAFFRHCVF